MKTSVSKFRLSSSFILIIFLLNTVLYSSSCTNNEDVLEEAVESDPNPVTERLSLTKTVPIGSNSWIVDDVVRDQQVISSDGIHNWTSLDDVINTFVRTGSGQLNVGLKMKSPEGTSKIDVTINGVTETITVNNTDYEVVDVGVFDVTEGYVKIKIQGKEKLATYIGDVNEILFGGTAVDSELYFVPTSNDHFGRRGPSVHMNYRQPEGKDIQWFYNEVTVPEGEDTLGSFFMTNGHAQGYFGMQVNSETERRVLFSIWSAYVTDDPNQIPDDYTVTSLGNGDGVTVQNFGGEGSGIQSFKNANWEAGTTYKFLLKGEPASVAGSTDYTAYFFDPEIGDWQLIASLRRPQTETYLTNPHSFLENFNPSTGNQSRKVAYGNQWAYTTENQWVEMTEATFTADATATNQERLDYAGGTESNTFFLKNCGFFNENVTPNSTFTRPAGNMPNIDFSALPAPTQPQNIILIDRTNWTIHDFSSEEAVGESGTDNGLASDVLDGDTETYWHSCWNGDCGSAEYPHHITIDMGVNTEIEGLQINQRSNESRAVSNITVSISTDATNWTSLGSFNLVQSASNQNVDFGALHTAKYVKVTMNSSHDGDRFASLAEIKGYKY